jgi:hypothetical protein
MDHDEAAELAIKGTLVAAKALLPAPVQVLVELAGLGLGKDGTDRLRDAVAQEIEDAVFTRLPEVERKMAVLARAGVRFNVSDFVRILEHFGKTWTKAADSGKRERLEAALVRSFDPELYKSGLLNTLWEKLDRLSYGDLSLLKDLHEAGANRDGLEDWHLADDDSLGQFHADNLYREGLVWSNTGMKDGRSARPNELGRRMHALAWEQLPEPGDQ